MRYSAAFLKAGLRGTDVEPPIQLRRIARDDFTAEPLGEANAQRGFARCRWSHNGKEKWLRVFLIHRNRR